MHLSSVQRGRRFARSGFRENSRSGVTVSVVTSFRVS